MNGVLHRIIISEGSKTYHTKSVDEENKVGLFLNYKALVQKVSVVILDINPRSPLPQNFASYNLFEMANNHIYFAQHLPRLTDVEVIEDNFDEVEKMLQHFAFALIK